MIRELMHQIGQLFTWLVLIAPWERALRIRLGKNVKELGPGTWIRVPFIDRVYRQSIRRRLSLISAQTLTTKDGHTITLAGSVGYQVRDLRKLYDTLHAAEDTIEAEVASKVSAFVTGRTLAECDPAALELHVREQIDLSQYGLEGQEFWLTNFVRVKTYRLLGGEIRTWSRSAGLDTEGYDRAGGVGPVPR